MDHGLQCTRQSSIVQQLENIYLRVTCLPVIIKPPILLYLSVSLPLPYPTASLIRSSYPCNDNTQSSSPGQSITPTTEDYVPLSSSLQHCPLLVVKPWTIQRKNKDSHNNPMCHKDIYHNNGGLLFTSPSSCATKISFLSYSSFTPPLFSTCFFLFVCRIDITSSFLFSFLF